MNNPRISTNKLTKYWASEVLEAYEKYPEEFKKLSNSPSTQWMRLLSSENVDSDCQVYDDLEINLGGGGSMKAARHAPNTAESREPGGIDCLHHAAFTVGWNPVNAELCASVGSRLLVEAPF